MVNKARALLKYDLVHNDWIVLISNHLFIQSTKKDNRKWYHKFRPTSDTDGDFQATSVEKHWKFFSDGTFVTDKCRKQGTWTVLGELIKGCVVLNLRLEQRDGPYEFEAQFVWDQKKRQLMTLKEMTVYDINPKYYNRSNMIIKLKDEKEHEQTKDELLRFQIQSNQVFKKIESFRDAL